MYFEWVGGRIRSLPYQKEDMTAEMSPDPETVAQHLRCHHTGASVCLACNPLILQPVLSLFISHSDSTILLSISGVRGDGE